MDSDSDEKSSEAKNDIFILPDVLLVRILSELSWNDIINLKLVSRSFYNFIHENYHQLNRREVSKVDILYDEDSEDFLCKVDLNFASIQNYESTNHPYGKSIDVQSGEELSRLLKIYDMRNLDYLSMAVREGTKIEFLVIYELSEKNLTSFQTFIDKLLLVKELSILNICWHPTKTKDVNPLSFLQSLNIIRRFLIYECNETRILSTDTVTNFLRRNPSVERLTIGSGNSEFMRSLFKEHFTLEQQHIIENNLSSKEICINLEFFIREYKELFNILENDLRERENVQEAISIQNFPEHSVIEGVINCKHCPKNMHKIKMHATLMDVYLNTCDRL